MSSLYPPLILGPLYSPPLLPLPHHPSLSNLNVGLRKCACLLVHKYGAPYLPQGASGADRLPERLGPHLCSPEGVSSPHPVPVRLTPDCVFPVPVHVCGAPTPHGYCCPSRRLSSWSAHLGPCWTLLFPPFQFWGEGQQMATFLPSHIPICMSSCHHVIWRVMALE